MFTLVHRTATDDPSQKLGRIPRRSQLHGNSAPGGADRCPARPAAMIAGRGAAVAGVAAARRRAAEQALAEELQGEEGS